MAEVAPGRSTPRRRLTTFTIVAIGALVGALFVSPASSQTLVPEAAVDVQAFSLRAAAWSAANVVHRDAAIDRAVALGEQAAEVEAEEAARAQAARDAALAAAAATTTAPPTTTAAPTTTTAPPTTVAPTTTAPATEPAPTTTTAAPTGGPTAAQWEALRHCESGGRYDAVNPNGRYRGAYQFSQATWDWVAGWANPALVGVDPATASAADQDAQAVALYGRQGAGPWPHCGVHLS